MRSFFVLVIPALLLAGCADRTGLAPGAFEQSPLPGGDSGLTMRALRTVEAIAPGDTRTWTFEVTNSANGRSIEINTACDGPFLVTLIGIQGNSLHHGGTAGAPCEERESSNLVPGASLSFDWTWDGRVSFDGGASKQGPIPGVYTIRVDFVGTPSGGAEERVLASGITKTTVGPGGGGASQEEERVDAQRTAGDWTTASPEGSFVVLTPLELHDRLKAGETRTWRFEARHAGGEGDPPISYNAACDGPFRVTLVGIYGNELDHGGPGGSPCEEHEPATLAPGGALSFAWPWNGSFRTQGGALVENPTEGKYAIRVEILGRSETHGDVAVLTHGETGVRLEPRR